MRDEGHKGKCGAGSFSRARFPERQSCHSKEEEEILFTKHSCSQLFPNSEGDDTEVLPVHDASGNKGKFRKNCDKNEYISSSTDDRLAFE